jgi:stress-induced-phosphoprotein 1
MADEEKNKGNEFYKAKDFENALRQYDVAIDLNPHEVNYRNNKAAVYFEMKEYEKCIEECDAGIKISQGGYYDYVKLGKSLSRKALALHHLGRMDESIEYYNKALLENNDYNTKEGLRKVEKAKKDKEFLEY